MPRSTNQERMTINTKIRVNTYAERTRILELLKAIARILDKMKGRRDHELERDLTEEDVRELISDVKELFVLVLSVAGIDEKVIRMMSTKFHDAGRRSPPWQPGSSKGVHRRPQDGADGNRRKRWLFPPEHKFYASEIVGTVVEVKFYFQTLSMDGAPALPNDILAERANVILGHQLKPGAFLDPISKLPIKFSDFVASRRAVESGHIIPLGTHLNGTRGRHSVDNATLMLRDSNRIQADKTLPELMEMLEGILARHGYEVRKPPP